MNRGNQVNLSSATGGGGSLTSGRSEEHAAVVAWRRLGRDRDVPCVIERLQKKKKGCVYRLRGVGEGGADVVGKVSTAERIAQERTIYEQVLPPLDVTGVEYYGHVEEPDGLGCWIFVADAGGEAYSPRSELHRALAGRWLARLHVSAAAAVANQRLDTEGLADRGAGYYLSQLRGARETLRAHLANPALSAGDVGVMREVMRQCDGMEARWAEVPACVEVVPSTFVHADFAPKNMRVRAGDVLVPYDWGSAGYGSVAADLAQAATGAWDPWDYWANVDLGAYLDGVRVAWRGVNAEDVRRMAALGKLFRCLVCVRLDAPSFAFDYVERAVWDLRMYRAAMAEALVELGWDV